MPLLADGVQQVMEDTLSTCPRLQALHIDNNRLQSFHEIDSTASLLVLSCAFNAVSDVKQLQRLKALPVRLSRLTTGLIGGQNLRVLDVHGNPIAAKEPMLCWATAVLSCSALDTMEGQPVTPSDRHRAQAYLDQLDAQSAPPMHATRRSHHPRQKPPPPRPC